MCTPSSASVERLSSLLNFLLLKIKHLKSENIIIYLR